MIALPTPPHVAARAAAHVCIRLMVWHAMQVASNADVLFVAVKPQHVGQVLSEVRTVLTPNHTIVSIAAGITIEK